MPEEAPIDDLRHSEALYRSLVERLPALTYISDAGGRTTYIVSEQVDRLLKLTDEDRDVDVDTRWERRLHPDDREAVLASWREAVASEMPHTFEYRLIRGDGKTIWVRDIESIVRDEGGAFVRRQGVTFDITDLVEARERAAEAEDRFRSLTEQMPAVLYRDSADASRAIYVSPAVHRVLGYSPQEWLDGSMDWYRKLVHPDDRERLMAGIRHSVATCTPHIMTYRLRHRDGRYLHVRDSVAFVAGPDGRPLWRQGMVSDVTEEIERVQRLDQADQRFRTLVDQMPAVTYLDDIDLKPMYVSPQVEELFGCSVEAWRSSPNWLRSFIGDHDFERVDAAYRALREDGTAYLIEYRVRRPDGSHRWVRDQAQRVHDSEGRPFALQGVMVDITERKRAEQRVARHVEQQRMVADLGIRALADEDWRVLADEAVRGVSRALGVSHVWVLELGEGTDRVTVRASAGWPEGIVDSCTAVVSDRPLARRVLDADDLIHIPDLDEIPSLWPDLIASEGLRSSAGVRIGSTPVYGVLGMHSAGSIAIDEEDTSFLQAVANVLAAAIHRHRTRQALEQSELRRRQTLSQLVRSGEEERQRIAAELHDDTIQVMTAALLTLDRELRAISEGDQLRATASVREMRRTLHEAVDRTRRLTFELRPPVLEARGLAAALEDLLAEVGSSAGFQVELEGDIPRLAPDIESLAYRTVQELVTNARKHARATRLSVSLLNRRDALDVVVSDDGVGFDRARAFAPAGLRLNFGLESSGERIRLAGGDFEVETRSGVGTTVRFSIPLAAA